METGWGNPSKFVSRNCLQNVCSGKKAVKQGKDECFLPLWIYEPQVLEPRLLLRKLYVLSCARYCLGSSSTPYFLEEVHCIAVPRAFHC